MLCCVLKFWGQCRQLSADTARHTMTHVSKLVLNQIFVASSPYPIVGTSGCVVIRISAGLSFVTCWLADNPLPFLAPSLCDRLCINIERWLNSSPEYSWSLPLPLSGWYSCIPLFSFCKAHTCTEYPHVLFIWRLPLERVTKQSVHSLHPPTKPPPPTLLPDLGLED